MQIIKWKRFRENQDNGYNITHTRYIRATDTNVCIYTKMFKIIGREQG